MTTETEQESNNTTSVAPVNDLPRRKPIQGKCNEQIFGATEANRPFSSAGRSLPPKRMLTTVPFTLLSNR